MDFDGLMIESHINPDEALSDKAQQVTPDALDKIIDELVVRRPEIPDAELNHKLSLLRKQIDLIDDDLLKLLGERMKVAEEMLEHLYGFVWHNLGYSDVCLYQHRSLGLCQPSRQIDTQIK